MKTRSLLKPSLFFVGMGLLAASCGDDDDKKKKSGSSGSNDANLNASMALNLTVSSSNSTSASLALVNDDGAFEATSILSGPPEQMTLYVTNMTLSGTDSAGSQSNLSIFENTEGKAIRIKGSKIDLSSLFETFDCVASDGTKVTLAEGESCSCGLDASGKVIPETDITNDETGETEKGCNLDEQDIAPQPLVAVSDGTYTSLGITYKGYATMKGCVAGYFRDSNNKTNENQKYNYCTKEGQSFFDTTVDAKASSFENAASASDVIKVPLGSPGQETLADASKFDALNATYVIPGGVKIEAGGKEDLTMLIDTNRMLRFENGGRDDAKKVFNGWSADRAYFFNSVFSESVFVFVGKPGEIKGYSWLANSCDSETKANTGNAYVCDASSTDYQAFLIGGWMTVIKDSDGNPLIHNIMPDDDATLTEIKGTNVTGSAEAGFTLDKTYFQTDAAGVSTIKYDLGDATGTIKSKLPAAVDATETGTFDGLNSSYGPISFIRKL